MHSTINEALEDLDPRIAVARGQSASDAWIAAAEKAAKTTFCPTYVSFLKEHGALRFTAPLASWYGDFTFPGHAPDGSELALERARIRVGEVSEEWKRAAPVCAPVLTMNGWDDAGVTASGTIWWFYRGVLHAERGTFEELATRWIARATEQLRAEDDKDAIRDHLLSAARDLLPAELGARYAGGRLTFSRPRDGVEIEARLGDGRELGGRGDPGVFVMWHEPGERPLAEINGYNAASAFVRASHAPGRVRYRGLLSAKGLAPELFVAALARDAGIALEPRQSGVPTLVDVLAAIAEPPAGKRLPRRWQPSDVVREGGALVTPLAVGWSLEPADSPTVRVRLDALGLVEVRWEAPLVAAEEDALTELDRVNGLVLGDVNLDLESCVQGAISSGAVTLRVVDTIAAASSEGFFRRLNELDRAITAARAITTAVDPMLAVHAAIERQFGLPLGDIGRALWTHIVDRSLSLLQDAYDRDRRGPLRLSSPWGELLRVGDVDHVGASRATHGDRMNVSVAIAREHGATFDACPVVGIAGPVKSWETAEYDACLLAPDVESFLHVLLLGTTAFGFDGDEEMLIRDHRSGYSWFAAEGAADELRRTLGSRGVTTVTAIQSAAAARLEGRPRVGKARFEAPPRPLRGGER